MIGIYEKDGTTVVAGKIKSIAEDKCSMVITYNKGEKGADKKTKEVPAEMTVKTAVPLDEGKFKEGFSVSAVGFLRGGNFTADAILSGNEVFEIDSIAAMTGFVNFAGLNEEKDENGSQKMKPDGVTPRAPHYDITLSVKEGDQYVKHIFSCYGYTLDEAKKKLANFKDRESTPVRISLFGGPGRKYENPSTGKVSYYHLTNKILNVDFLQAREKTAEAKPVAPSVPAQEPEEEFACEKDEWGE